ncbi:hypothetical protein CC80DRAFT_96646 [Byssothecium circinans]|uniref:GmrSD restriction endonucleases N-terminal domain-containing protein n=1 Tax=Byssothecium circinans TaxID=147558 RepID=A0A6A5UFK6_9PLEO|nr:hypothetical protein CC80DRAFT_96646 [Byssothecium circinans]
METPESKPAPIKDEDSNEDDFLDEEAQEDAASYRPRTQLSKPGTFLRNLNYFMKGLDEETIDINPEYQREVVWTAERMTGLINSLMENYYIPPIILNKKSLPAGNGRLQQISVCVDGKQRLSSVQAFIKGIIPCNDRRGEKWYFCDTPNRSRRKILPDTVRREFLSKEFVSFEYTDLTAEQEEDLFARVQMGVQLTAAEKMRASTGPWQELAKCYVEDFPVIYGLLKDRSRAKDFQVTLACYSQILEVQHPTAATGVPSLKTNYTSLPKLLANEAALDDDTKSHLASVWNTFQDLINLDPNIFTNADKSLRGVQTFAPVEMVAVTVIISMYSETRNNRLLLGDIKYLRDELRVRFVDLRMNTHVWKFLWEFIDNLEQVRGAVDSTIDRSVLPKPAGAPKPARRAAEPLPGITKGRPTLRTKRPAVVPGQSASPVAEQEENATTAPPVDARPLKRQRTDPEPDDTTASENLFLGTRSSSGLISPALSPSLTTQTLPAPISTTQKARRTPANKRPPPPVPLKTTLQATPTPTEARQNRVSELNGFRAPVAPMVTAASFASMTAPAPSPTGPTLETTHALPSRSRVPTSSPIRQPSIFQEVIKPISPVDATPQKSLPHSKARALQQYDGAIDLTVDDDVEQERQDLLSAFRPPASAVPEPRNTTTPTLTPATSPRLPNRANSLSQTSSGLTGPRVAEEVVVDVESNNPYQLLKQRKFERLRLQQLRKQQKQSS